MNKKSIINDLSPVKRALVAINKLQIELKKVKQMKNESIAIIGFGCRFPFAENPYEFWNLLIQGNSGISQIPLDRWDINEFYSEDNSGSGKMNTKWGGFVKDIDKFDPKLFGISPREANHMDPQQRVLLETIWQTFENSGIHLDKIKGSKTGVFIGIGNSDYSQFTYGNYSINSSYTALGNASCIAANRISYLFDLIGPSLSIDTACSSSLVAVHLACKSILNGESDMAIAGGVNLILSPDAHISFSQAQMMAVDGKCKSFDESANGYVRSEGCGVVLLKRLSEAIKDKDNILAVIKGSVVNQDGKSNGISAPNKIAQEKLIRDTLEVSNVSIDEIDYIETHGTGTRLGDPIEIQALTEVFCNRKNEKKILLGALKTNIGHTEVAAGIAGLIKVILSINNGTIPQNLNFHKINPLIPIDKIPFKLVNENIEWKSNTKNRIAGISSFGFGGTNAHLIVEEYKNEIVESIIAERPFHLFTLSANEKKTLSKYLISHQNFINKFKNIEIGNYCYSVNLGKKKFDYRISFVIRDINELSNNINNFLKNKFETDCFTNALKPERENKIAFIFTGQGSQYINMGKELYETNLFYKNQIDECVKIVDKFLNCSFLEILFDEKSSDRINSTLYTQPALFVVEYSLAKLWISWGIKPDLVLGHSVGEITAAAIAKVFSLEDALKLVCLRATLMNSIPQNGKMSVVFCTLNDVENEIKKYNGDISIAAVNGPNNIVISGDSLIVNKMTQNLMEKQIKCHELNVSHAFHSSLMLPIVDEFENSIKDIEFKTSKIPIISNLSGEIVEENKILDENYWKQHILNPVLFYQSMKSVTQLGINTFLEIGPNPILIGMSQIFLNEENNLWLPSLQNGKNDWQIMLNSLKEFFNIGVNINWKEFENGYNRKLILVPTYPFNKERYWIENAKIPSLKNKFINESSEIFNEKYLLGKKLDSPVFSDIIFENDIDSDSLSILQDHIISQTKLFPVAGFIELVLTNINSELKEFDNVIEYLTIVESINFQKNNKKLQTIFTSKENNKFEFKIYSKDIDEKQKNWNLNVIGELKKYNKIPQKEVSDKYFNQNFNSKRLLFDKESIRDYYTRLKEYGFEYGPSMQNIVEIWQNDTTIYGLLELSSEYKNESNNYNIHPSIVDAGFQLVASYFINKINDRKLSEGIYLPVGLENLKLYKSQFNKAWCKVLPISNNFNQNNLYFELHFFDEFGELLLEIKNIKFGFISNQNLPQILGTNIENWFYKVKWIEKQLEFDTNRIESKDNSVLVFSNNSLLDINIQKELKNKYQSVISIINGTNFKIIDDELYEINFSSFDDYKKLFTNLFLSKKNNIIHIINLTNINLETSDHLNTKNLYIEQFDSIRQFLYFIKSIVISGLSKFPKVWLIQNNSLCLENSDKVDLINLPLIGFCKVVNSEFPDLKLTLIDFENIYYERIIPQLINEIANNEFDERQIFYKNNKRFVSRLTKIYDNKKQNSESDSPRRLVINSKGVLDNLELIPIERKMPDKNWVEIEVHSTGLNFRDVLNALDLYPGDAGLLGGECSGIITAVGEDVSKFKIGDEVLGIASGSFSTHVSTHENLLTMKPKNISFEEAATIPIAFLTAYYALVKIGNLSKGEKVLIHAATGGVGLAAIQIAKMCEAEIYATAGNPEKRELLESIGIKYVFNSRSLDFADKILNINQGIGIDIILNSFNGKYIEKGLSILSSKGRFLEIGKIGIWSKQKVKEYRNDIIYHTIAIDDLSKNNSKLINEMMNEIISLFEKKIFIPIKKRTFSIDESVSAFKLMRSTKHIGKIIINQKHNKINNIEISSESTYIITGGRGALGIVFMEWLVKKGAKFIVLIGRNKISNKIKNKIDQIEKNKGTKIITPTFDISSFEETEKFLSDFFESDVKKEEKLPPIKGIIHAAGVLEDSVLLNQNEENFDKVLSPKIKGAWNLHLLTKDIKLDFMVYFSSISSVFGSPGQANYASANAFLDGLADYRKKLNLPATSINWGPWKGEGMAAKLSKNLGGINQISKNFGTIVFEKVLIENHNNIIILPIHWEEFINQFNNLEIPAFFNEFIIKEKAKKMNIIQETDYITELKKLNRNERLNKLIELIEINLRKILGMSPNEKVGIKKPLSEFGLDSLMGFELKKNLDQALGKNIPVTMVFNYPTIEAMSVFILNDILDLEDKNNVEKQNANSVEELYSEDIIKEIKNLNEDEVEALLLKKLNQN